jgi:hypothetical protein
MHTKFWSGNLKGKTDIDGRITLKWILSKEGMSWFNLVQDSIQQMALMNTVMNIQEFLGQLCNYQSHDSPPWT